jgi:hypothetical protein
MSQTHMGLDNGSSISIPRWVKVFGIVALVLVHVVVIIMFTGVGGEHDPGRVGASGRTLSTAHGVQQP